MFDLSGSVGLGGRNARHDVALVQMALGVIKRRTKNGMKPYHDGRVDGRFDGPTLTAIRAFLAENQVKAARPKIERSGPAYSALRRALPSEFRGVNAVPETAILFRDRGGRDAAAQRARETLTKIPLPDKARMALAKAQKEIGAEMNLVLGVKDRDVTRAGAFSVKLHAPQAEWLDPQTRRFRKSGEIPIQARHFVRQRLLRSSEWRGTGRADLSIETAAAIAALQGPPKLTAAQERLYGRPIDPVVRAAVAAAANMIAEGALHKPKRNREFALLLQAVKVANPRTAGKLLAAATSGRSLAELEEAVKEGVGLMQAEAATFARTFVRDATVREWYLREIKNMSKRFVTRAKSGQLTVIDAADLAVGKRNGIMVDSRYRGSSLGRAIAQKLKPEGTTLPELLQRNAIKLFEGRRFGELNTAQQTAVFKATIESAGRDSSGATDMVRKIGHIGRALWVLTFVASAYEIAIAESRIREAFRQAAIVGGGVVGGAAGGAVAGLACGPGAPICVAIGIIIGGVLGGLAAETKFDAVF